jgi:hypothetical protein
VNYEIAISSWRLEGGGIAFHFKGNYSLSNLSYLYDSRNLYSDKRAERLGGRGWETYYYL